MSKIQCVDCGTCFDANLDSCPNCGCPKYACTPVNYIQNPTDPSMMTSTPVPYPAINGASQKRDWAHYIYESGVLFWDTLTKRYCSFSGRASRREYWSFYILIWLVPELSIILAIPPICFIYLLACMIPLIGVAVRRMHDVNKSGWWIICPVAWFFLLLKKSDEGENDYGEPMDYSEILS